jgi:mitogen-activated protein kinase kinase
VEGNPPDLPKDSYSSIAQEFVAGCLHKKPQSRPTYGMLLKHAWMAPSIIPETIVEEGEEEEEDAEEVEAAGAVVASSFERLSLDTGAGDAEVAAWVKEALQKAAAQPSGQSPHKPALHRAPLDVVSPATSPLIGSGNTTNLWGTSESGSGNQ